MKTFAERFAPTSPNPRFIDLDVAYTKSPNDISASGFRSNDFYLAAVKHIQVDRLNLSNIIRRASYVATTYPQIVSMKGKDWEINFYARTITAHRSVSAGDSMPTLGKNITIPGFRTIDGLDVVVDSRLGFQGVSGWSNDLPPQPKLGTLRMEDVNQFNIRSHYRPTSDSDYLTPIRSLTWYHDPRDEQPHWMTSFPSWKSLESLTDTGKGEILDLDTLQYLMSNP